MNSCVSVPAEEIFKCCNGIGISILVRRWLDKIVKLVMDPISRNTARQSDGFGRNTTFEKSLCRICSESWGGPGH